MTGAIPFTRRVVLFYRNPGKGFSWELFRLRITLSGKEEGISAERTAASSVQKSIMRKRVRFSQKFMLTLISFQPAGRKLHGIV